jgi:acyl-CoA thioesterase II
MATTTSRSEDSLVRQAGGVALAELVALLDVKSKGGDHFEGLSPGTRWQRVYGGQVLGQALVAAQRTVKERSCHSLHAYFLRAGNPKNPILYQVQRSRDGRSFSARHVVALQKDQPIFTMSASFQYPEDGFEHQMPMPDVPPPDSLKNESEWREAAAERLPAEIRAWFLRERPIEIRPVLPEDRFSGEPHPPRQILWVRAKGKLADAHALHQCVLAYASDMSLLDTSLLPHAVTLFTPGLQLASLDHAMWFHRPLRVDEWLLYVQESPSAAGARGFNTGNIFRQDGTLVASVAQEGLMRRRN